MTGLDRRPRFHCGQANDRYRRTSPVAGRPAEGLLTEPRAVARPGARELVIMSHCCRSRRDTGWTAVDPKPTLVGARASDASCPLLPLVDAVRSSAKRSCRTRSHKSAAAILTL